VTVTIQVLRQSRVATYAIDMEPISLERIDVLESKMRDMQEEIRGLRGESEATVATHGNVHGEVTDTRDEELSELKQQVQTLVETQDCVEIERFQATAKVGDRIAWGNLANEVLRVTHPGTYQVTAVVNHKARNTAASIQLFNGPECIQTANCGIGEATRTGEGSHSSTCLSCVTRVKKHHEFSVKCPVSLAGTSYLTLVRIGSSSFASCKEPNDARQHAASLTPRSRLQVPFLYRVSPNALTIHVFVDRSAPCSC
jgi:hypothetical protein